MRTLLVVVDSLRADALGCYGSTLATPTVDHLAASGARFETVISSAPWTLPSLAAMLTGVWSHRLGLLKWEQPWPRELPTLFDCFRARGIETASFVFDPSCLFRSCPEASVVGCSQDTAPMLAWLRERQHRDYFALVHYWWTHVPYLGRKLPLAAWNKVCSQILELLSVADPAERRANREQVKGLYALAVQHFSETWLPALLDAARADVVVLVADHGESWGERLAADRTLRDVFDLHGNHLHDEVMAVPWIVHAPGLVAPAVVKGVARTVDLAPTLVELLELDSPTHRAPTLHATQAGFTRSGRSLVPALLSGEIAGDPLAFCARNLDFVDARALPTDPDSAYVELACRDRASKVIDAFRGGDAREYDLGADPGELCPKALGDPASSALGRALESERQAAVVAAHDPDDFARMKAQLRSLGYL